jgi:hypothetical protein
MCGLTLFVTTHFKPRICKLVLKEYRARLRHRLASYFCTEYFLCYRLELWYFVTYISRLVLCQGLRCNIHHLREEVRDNGPCPGAALGPGLPRPSLQAAHHFTSTDLIFLTHSGRLKGQTYEKGIFLNVIKFYFEFLSCAQVVFRYFDLIIVHKIECLLLPLMLKKSFL